MNIYFQRQNYKDKYNNNSAEKRVRQNTTEASTIPSHLLVTLAGMPVIRFSQVTESIVDVLPAPSFRMARVGENHGTGIFEVGICLQIKVS